MRLLQPPRSKSGACMRMGGTGSWEIHDSPKERPGEGNRVTKGPGPQSDPQTEGAKELRDSLRYRDARDNRSIARREKWKS